MIGVSAVYDREDQDDDHSLYHTGARGQVWRFLAFSLLFFLLFMIWQAVSSSLTWSFYRGVVYIPGGNGMGGLFKSGL